MGNYVDDPPFPLQYSWIFTIDVRLNKCLLNARACADNEIPLSVFFIHRSSLGKGSGWSAWCNTRRRMICHSTSSSLLSLCPCCSSSLSRCTATGKSLAILGKCVVIQLLFIALLEQRSQLNVCYVNCLTPHIILWCSFFPRCLHISCRRGYFCLLFSKKHHTVSQLTNLQYFMPVLPNLSLFNSTPLTFVLCCKWLPYCLACIPMLSVYK